MKLLRYAFVLLVVYPVVYFWLGMNVRHRARIPLKGPAIIVANHNSHLDILALYSLFPLKTIPNVHPAAAADYFLTKRWLAFFALHMVGIVPVIRSGAKKGCDPLGACHAALAANKILIIFPEGTRGEAEKMAELKSGIWHLARAHPQVPIVPVYMHGLGKSMPKGAWIPLPIFVDVFVGQGVAFAEDKSLFMQELTSALLSLNKKIVPDTSSTEESTHASTT